MVQNFIETMADVGKGIASIPSLARKGYEGAREFMEFESPGLFTPDADPASMPQVDTTTTDATPATMTELGKPSTIAQLIDQYEAKEEDKSEEEKPTIPKVNGDESSNELNQKEEAINSNLDELAIRLSKFARSDPRKPGGYTAASFQRDQEILAEKQKAQALRMKQKLDLI